MFRFFGSLVLLGWVLAANAAEPLSRSPAQGRNNVVSGHGNPYYAVFGPPYLAEGEIAVLRAGGEGRFDVVARVRLADWESLQP